jgi:hypothetical protein
VTDHDYAVQSKPVEQLEHVGRECLLPCGFDGIAMNGVGGPESEEIGRDSVPERSDARQDMSIVEPETRPAVQEDDCRSRADTHVVHPPAAQIGKVVGHENGTLTAASEQLGRTNAR